MFKNKILISGIILIVFSSCTPKVYKQKLISLSQSRVFLDFDFKHSSLKQTHNDISESSKLKTKKRTNSKGVTFTYFTWVDKKNKITYQIYLNEDAMEIVVHNKGDEVIWVLWNDLVFNSHNGIEKLVSKEKNQRAAPGETILRRFTYPSLQQKIPYSKNSPDRPFINFKFIKEVDNTKAKEKARESETVLDDIVLLGPDYKPAYWKNEDNSGRLFRTYWDGMQTAMDDELVKAKEKYLNQNYSVQLSSEINGVANDYLLSFSIADIKISEKTNIKPLPKLGDPYDRDEHSRSHSGYNTFNIKTTLPFEYKLAEVFVLERPKPTENYEIDKFVNETFNLNERVVDLKIKLQKVSDGLASSNKILAAIDKHPKGAIGWSTDKLSKGTSKTVNNLKNLNSTITSDDINPAQYLRKELSTLKSGITDGAAKLKTVPNDLKFIGKDAVDLLKSSGDVLKAAKGLKLLQAPAAISAVNATTSILKNLPKEVKSVGVELKKVMEEIDKALKNIQNLLSTK